MKDFRKNLDKVLVLDMPIDESVVHNDTPMEDRGRRAELSAASFKAIDGILQSDEDVKAIIALVYTPRGPRDPAGPHDSIHQCMVSADDFDAEDMKKFIDMAIPTLIKLRFMLDEDPDQFATMKPKQ